MQDRSEALQIFGLAEEASRQEIENRYFHFVKKYKHLAPDEQPSLGEPIFAVINQAYRLLIGYVPMQCIQFKELKWKEKLEHIREYYMFQITICVIVIVAVCSLGIVVRDMNKIMQTATTSSHVTSTVDKPLTAVDCKQTQR
jgi:ABC-type polysaccharide/polyol phosphate export permease